MATPKKHKLIMIGGMANYNCYLDIDFDEAVRRFKLPCSHESEKDQKEWVVYAQLIIDNGNYKIIEFNEEFNAYDIEPNED